MALTIVIVKPGHLCSAHAYTEVSPLPYSLLHLRAVLHSLRYHPAVLHSLRPAALEHHSACWGIGASVQPISYSADLHLRAVLHSLRLTPREQCSALR